MSSVEPPQDPATIAVTAGRPARVPDAPLNTPIVAASTFVAGGATEYAREGGPTIAAFESVLAALEGAPEPELATAIAYSSGMAAADAVLDTVPNGGQVIAPTTAYTGVSVRLRELRDRGAIELHLIDVPDTEAVVAAMNPDVDLLWLESPTNPLLEQADLATLLGTARTMGIRTVVDNTFATPLLQQPLHLGADISLHSATKGLSGHSDLLLGALVVADDELAEVLRTRRTLLGAVPSAFDAYLATRGIRTLAVRMTKAHATTAVLAERLAAEPRVSRVRAFGSMLTMEFGGNVDLAARICDATRIWVHATSLGGVESSLERRRRWPLEADHVPEDLVRASVGIEDADDLWQDLARAIRES